MKFTTHVIKLPCGTKAAAHDLGNDTVGLSIKDSEGDFLSVDLDRGQALALAGFILRAVTPLPAILTNAAGELI